MLRLFDPKRSMRAAQRGCAILGIALIPRRFHFATYSIAELFPPSCLASFTS